MRTRGGREYDLETTARSRGHGDAGVSEVEPAHCHSGDLPEPPIPFVRPSQDSLIISRLSPELLSVVFQLDMAAYSTHKLRLARKRELQSVCAAFNAASLSFGANHAHVDSAAALESLFDAVVDPPGSALPESSPAYRLTRLFVDYNSTLAGSVAHRAVLGAIIRACPLLEAVEIRARSLSSSATGWRKKRTVLKKWQQLPTADLLLVVAGRPMMRSIVLPGLKLGAGGVRSTVEACPGLVRLEGSDVQMRKTADGSGRWAVRFSPLSVQSTEPPHKLPLALASALGASIAELDVASPLEPHKFDLGQLARALSNARTARMSLQFAYTTLYSESAVEPAFSSWRSLKCIRLTVSGVRPSLIGALLDTGATSIQLVCPWRDWPESPAAVGAIISAHPVASSAKLHLLDTRCSIQWPSRPTPGWDAGPRAALVQLARRCGIALTFASCLR